MPEEAFGHCQRVAFVSRLLGPQNRSRTMAKIYGLEGPDYLGGTAAGDAIAGKAGDDFIDGWLGDDRIWGGAGNDTVVAGDGADVVAGKAGDDTIFGEGLPPGDLANVDEFDWQGG